MYIFLEAAVSYAIDSVKPLCRWQIYAKRSELKNGIKVEVDDCETVHIITLTTNEARTGWLVTVNGTPTQTKEWPFNDLKYAIGSLVTAYLYICNKK